LETCIALSLYSLQRGEWQNLFPLCFSGEEKQLLFRAAIFAKQKTNTVEQESDRHVIKATKEISMQHLILLAVVSMMVLYVLIIVAVYVMLGGTGVGRPNHPRSYLMIEGASRA